MKDIASRIAEHLEGLKTKLVAILFFVFGALEVIDPYLLADMLGPNSRGFVIIGMAVLMYILRNLSKGPAKPIRKAFDTESGRGL